MVLKSSSSPSNGSDDLQRPEEPEEEQDSPEDSEDPKEDDSSSVDSDLQNITKLLDPKKKQAVQPTHLPKQQSKYHRTNLSITAKIFE